MHFRHPMLLTSLVLFGLACASQRPQTVDIPAEIRSDWDRCEAAITRWCIDHSHGSSAEERNCMMTESRHYVEQPDEAARRAYLTSHGCRL
jgi:hypothetical protein